ncbi:MAG TPA: hypothetical protein VFC19_12600 [Candidatus Limnocylindrales bacterium]|nr:hypothetical protein [Candidatus Limnocylindrales bacterium]
MAVEALYWNQGSIERQTRDVSSEGDVEALAGELLSQYESAGDMAPGIELRRDSSGAGLSVALTSDGWALIHTDSEFTQHCTRSSNGGDAALDVMWEEAQSIPQAWFVPKNLALRGVARYLADGGLADEITWSEDCS